MALGGVGCSGGGSAGPVLQSSCTAPSAAGPALCLQSCNLGCTQAGCGINQIAQNQPIVLVFSQDVDPATVSSATVSLRTTTGEEPVGQLLTNGPTVMFVPEIRVVGSQSFFGFRPAETYQLYVRGGNQVGVLRSTAGDPLLEDYRCSLSVTLGVVDFDGQPPSAELLSPVLATGVDPLTPIVLEFSEVIDQAPFITSSNRAQPVAVTVRDTRPAPGGGVQCDPASAPVVVPGTWDLFNDPLRQLTVGSFRPDSEVPGGLCVEVRVTPRVVDLSGKPAAEKVFSFVTAPSQRAEVALVETFDNDLQLDHRASSGVWANGEALPGAIGGDAIHGVFDPADGTEIAPGVYEWNTEDSLISRVRTRTGTDLRVTDGVYRFSQFHIGAGTTVRFVGAHPARISVSGNAVIDGVLDLSGVGRPMPDGDSVTGQPGADGGAAGGAAGSARGGAGADRCNGLGALPRFSGERGRDAVLSAGHAYAARAAGSGGRGSALFPADGRNASVVTTQVAGLYSSQVAAGGGGGALMAPGEAGTVVATHNGDPAEAGPDGRAGREFSLLPRPAGSSSLDHFVVGGAGGGGAGGHPFFSIAALVSWRSGGGGAAGGGAVAVRAGRDLSVSDTGAIDASGGSTTGMAGVLAPTNAYAVPGGGGSGGSILLQVGQRIDQDGGLDVAGGSAGTTFGPPAATMEARGGAGGRGQVRVEVAGGGAASLIGSVTPASGPGTSIAGLVDRDPVVASQSLWIGTQQLFPPEFLRYELDAIVDGVPITYSDDPTVGVLATDGQPVRLWIQGAQYDPGGNVDPTTVSGWLRYVGGFAPAGEVVLDTADATVLRFQLLFDRGLAQSVSVQELRVFYRPF